MNFVIEHLSKHFEKKEVLRDITFTFGRAESTVSWAETERARLPCSTVSTGISGRTAEPFSWRRKKAGGRLGRGDIGYVLSTPTVPEFLTGREFLKFFLDINEKSIPNPKSPEEYFDYMSIAPEDRDRLLKDYSHGMKNKMQMLVNIIAQPNLLLLDEPLTSLDVVVAEEMKQLLRSLKENRIIVFSTHIMDLALDLCDEIVLLNHGELEAVEKQHLNAGEFREKIIAALREEEHD